MRARLRTAVPAIATAVAVCLGGTAVTAAGFVVASTAVPGGEQPHAFPSSSSGHTPAVSPEHRPRMVTTPASRVAPLRRVLPPDLLVVAKHPLDSTRVGEIKTLDGVRAVITFDAGALRVGGRPINVLGVDPSEFRSWTPPHTAASNALWKALAQDDMVTSFAARKAYHLKLGDMYKLRGKRRERVRLGGVAALGLPGIEALVKRETGRRLGLVHDLGLLVNAPGVPMGKLKRTLRLVLGHDAQLLSTRDATSPAHAPAPGTSGPSHSPPGKATTYKQLYMRAAATCPGLSWTVLAAIGQIESGHGRNNGPSSAGALGPMQFMPNTWRSYGVDGDDDGVADINNPYDAVPAAARYLCAHGAGNGDAGLRRAVYAYNHAHWYVREVLGLARAYARQYG
ncbi:MAG: lytic transglycosylase domain-containing protein [Streptosporangiaceae bacterium]